MEKKAFSTNKAPKPGGPYSQVVKCGSHVYVSGQLGFEPETGDLVKGGIRAETEKTFENVRNVLEAAGAEMSDVIRVQVLLADLSDFGAMNEVYAEAFPFEVKPARTTFQAGAMPKGSRIEVDVVAIISES